MSIRYERGVAKAVKCIDKCLEDVSKLQYCFINCYFGLSLVEAYNWIEKLMIIMKETFEKYGFRDILYSREFRSFIEDPLKHLGKKLFTYTHDYIRGRIDQITYAEKAMMAINTSLRTNMRMLYQNWCILALLINMCRYSTRVIYPEHRVLSLERSGKQKLKWIPPNLVIDVKNYGSLSIFIEVPRPISWGDTSDLAQTWKLYTALRPDTMIYGGFIHDIVDLDNTPPIKRPDIIVEYKELPDWYRRVRDIRGPLAKPISAEEWRTRWIEGLYTGLADVLGVSRSEAIEELTKPRSVRLSEVNIVKLYYSIYGPREMILISKYRIPINVLDELRSHNIIVYDEVGFSIDKLSNVVDELIKYAKPVDEYIVETSDYELYDILSRVKELWEKNNMFRDILRKIIQNNDTTIAET